MIEHLKNYDPFEREAPKNNLQWHELINFISASAHDPDKLILLLFCLDIFISKIYKKSFLTKSLAKKAQEYIATNKNLRSDYLNLILEFFEKFSKVIQILF